MRRFGLIGNPLMHSFSQAFFTEKFRRQQIADCRYDNFELATLAHLPTILKAHADLCGFNVTIPYKKEILSYLTQQSPVVQAVGACNCVVVDGPQLRGHNTDVFGFTEALKPFLKPHHTAALVLGTGGSSNAVQYALQQLGIPYRLVSRTAAGANLTYAQIDAAILKAHTLVINTTPVGMYPHIDAAPELPYNLLRPQHLLFDLIYNPEETLFLQKGEAQGAAIANGHAMLILQAEESWRIWNA